MLFFYKHVTRKKLPEQRLYKKFARSTLMKLIPRDQAYPHDTCANQVSFDFNSFKFEELKNCRAGYDCLRTAKCEGILKMWQLWFCIGVVLRNFNALFSPKKS